MCTYESHSVFICSEYFFQKVLIFVTPELDFERPIAVVYFRELFLRKMEQFDLRGLMLQLLTLKHQGFLFNLAMCLNIFHAFGRISKNKCVLNLFNITFLELKCSFKYKGTG
jgi:hypothetical protein